jgi:hypothetical protein
MKTSLSISVVGLIAALSLIAAQDINAQKAPGSADKPQSTIPAVRAKTVLNPDLSKRPVIVMEDPVIKDLKAHIAALEKRGAAAEERTAALEKRLALLEPSAYKVIREFPGHTHPYKIRTWGQTTAANIYMHGKAGVYVPIPTVDKGGTKTLQTQPPKLD